jgi:hypothetical protein
VTKNTVVSKTGSRRKFLRLRLKCPKDVADDLREQKIKRCQEGTSNTNEWPFVVKVTKDLFFYTAEPGSQNFTGVHFLRLRKIPMKRAAPIFVSLLMSEAGLAFEEKPPQYRFYCRNVGPIFIPFHLGKLC